MSGTRLIPISSINGTNMSDKLQPAKGGYNVSKSDLYSDSTHRTTETGKLMAYLIRENICTIGLEYVGTAAQIAEIEDIITPPHQRQYSVTFLDNETYITRTMYPSDRQKPTEVIIDGVPKMRLTFSLVEV